KNLSHTCAYIGSAAANFHLRTAIKMLVEFMFVQSTSLEMQHTYVSRICTCISWVRHGFSLYFQAFYLTPALDLSSV
ncbi:hypothetical protein HAX54_017670, partial [Datura stramonium]|nr:hypothetical protein [Datura stramonium]